jgi:hypothetical protein
VKSISEAIASAREQGFGKMLVVLTDLTGMQPPSLGERHAMVRDWAGAAQGRIRLANAGCRSFRGVFLSTARSRQPG